MKRREFHQTVSSYALGLTVAPSVLLNMHPSRKPDEIKIGIIGLDTSHSVAFTKIFQQGDQVSGFRVTHAYPEGSRTIESSVSRIPEYTLEIKALGVTIVDSIESLLSEVDVVLLETNDGRLHLEQAMPVFEARKPVFIDKPIAASLSDTLALFEAAKTYQVPMFSASSLRFAPSTQEVATGNKIGAVLGADTYSPATIEPTHPDLFWYGIHGVEALYTIMGTGCKQVRRVFREDMDIVVGEWEDGRIGTFRGIRKGKSDYGGRAFGTEGIATVGKYEGYEPLVVEIAKFFQTGEAPVAPEETIEIFAFMAAADESKAQEGAPITIESVIKNVQKG